MSIPNLQAPYRDKEDSSNQNKGSSTVILILLGVIVCLIVIIIALLLAPASNNKITERKNENSNKNQLLEKKLSEIPGQTIPGVIKPFNKNSQIEWLMIKTEAEKNNMPSWAAKDYNKAIEWAAIAEKFKQQEKNEPAENHYQQATELLSKTLQEKQQRLKGLMKKGEQAFEKNDLLQAKKSFESARLIDPENNEIKNALERLNQRNEVNHLYEQALADKKNNDQVKAISYLEKALELEPDNKKIKSEWNTLKQEEKNSKFNEKISTVLEAIEDNDLNRASEELKKAKRINGSDPVIMELEKRLLEKNRIHVISQLQKKARQQESREQWMGALTSYKKILNYDADENNAKTSHKRVEMYINLNTLLDTIIVKPQRLQNDKIFEQAKKTLVLIKNEIIQKNNLLYPLEKTPKLSKNILLADKIIKQASMVIPINIISDNKTDIVIYKVGKFGKLINKTILLRTGEYTIVGSRSGYRDIRKKININANKKTQSINVQCQEKI